VKRGGVEQVRIVYCFCEFLRWEMGEVLCKNLKLRAK
jgi:hypothetical protein